MFRVAADFSSPHCADLLVHPLRTLATRPCQFQPSGTSGTCRCAGRLVAASRSCALAAAGWSSRRTRPQGAVAPRAIAAERRPRATEPGRRHPGHDARRPDRRLRPPRRRRPRCSIAWPREGVLFEQAMTSAPLTLPAHATMFTGALPAAARRSRQRRLLPATRADDAGRAAAGARLRTGAFVGAFVLDSKWGLDQGFEHYADDFDLSEGQGAVARQRAAAGRRGGRPGPAVARDRAGRRFFAWLHFYDRARALRRRRSPSASRYAGQPYNGEIAFADAQLGGWSSS